MSIYKPRMSESIKKQIEQGNLSNTSIPAQDWVKVYSTEYPDHNTKNHTFKPFKITASKLCSGDYHLPLKVEFYRFKYGKTPTYKGETIITVSQIKDLNMKNFTFYKKSGEKKVGDLHVINLKVEPNYHFGDYIVGG